MSKQNDVIFSDSASVLQAVELGKKHPITCKINQELQKKNILLAWIPGHIGIIGNEKVDQLANEGRFETLTNSPTPKADAIKWTQTKIWENHTTA